MAERIKEVSITERPRKRMRFGPSDDMEEEAIVPPSSKDLLRWSRTYLKEVVMVSADYIAHVRSIPQHLPSGEANPEWLDARMGRVTGSNAIKAAVRTNTDIQRRRFDSELLHGISINTAVRCYMDYGNKNESNADKSLKAVLTSTKIKCSYPGLLISETSPWLAMSPDGIFTIDSVPCLVEYKCRAYMCLNFEFRVDAGILQKRRGTGGTGGTGGGTGWQIVGDFFSPTSKDKWMRRDTELFDPSDPVVALPIPPAYLAQVRHGCIVTGIREVIFCTWLSHTGDFEKLKHPQNAYVTPHGTVQVFRFKLNEKSLDVQKKRVHNYYFSTLLPNYVLKMRNCHGLYPRK